MSSYLMEPSQYPESKNPGTQRDPAGLRQAHAHTLAYRLYALGWGFVGAVLAVGGMPQALSSGGGLLGLLVALSAAGNLIVVRFPGEVVFTMQGPVALAGVWLAGWPLAVPVNLVSAAILALTHRATVWRALLYLGNATFGMYAADRVFRTVSPGPADLTASLVAAGALVLAGGVFGVLTGAVISLGRFLDTRNPDHLAPRRLAVLSAAPVLLYVPLSSLMVTALRAGPGGTVLATSVWVLASLAVKGLVEAREANRRLEAALRSLEQAAATDPLTGLYNRRRFEEAFAWECRRAGRSGSPASLLVADVQGLKRANDRFGHHVGDLLLEAVASALRRTIRSTDMAFRVAGDEFAILLPDTDSGGAALVAQAVADEVARTGVYVEGVRLNPRVSVGTATCPDDGLEPSQVARAADLAMYRARAAGRVVGQASGPLAMPEK